MAMTNHQLDCLLKQSGFPYVANAETESFYLPAPVKNYEGPGAIEEPGIGKFLPMIARLSDEGRMFSLSVKRAFHTSGSPYLEIFLKLCSVIQAMPEPVQFHYNPLTSQVDTIIEIPLMDNTLTAQQLQYCLKRMHFYMEEHCSVLEHILQQGTEGLPDPIRRVLESDQPPPANWL